MKRVFIFIILIYITANAATVTLSQELNYQLKSGENKKVAENNAMANLKNLLMEDAINLVVSKRDDNDAILNEKERDFIAETIQGLSITNQKWEEDVFFLSGKIEVDLESFDAISKPEKQEEISAEDPDAILARIRKYRENAYKTKEKLAQMEIEKKYENSENQRLALENFQQGRIAQTLRQYNTSVYYYEKALEYDPQFPNAFFSLGVTYSMLDDHLKAIKYYKKAIKHKIDDEKAYFNLGISYDAINNYDKAIEAYKEAIRLNPNYVQAYYNLGSAYLVKGEYDKAIESYQIVLSFNPEFAEVYFNIGVAYDEKEVYEESISAYKQSLKYRPDYVNALSNLGYAYFNNAQYNQAIESLEKAKELDKQDPDIFLKLGKSYEAINAEDKMIEAYQNAAYLGDRSAQKYLKDREISW